MLTTGDTVLSESYVESKSTILTPLQWLHQVLQEQDVEDYCGPLSIPYFSLDYEKVKLFGYFAPFLLFISGGMAQNNTSVFVETQKGTMRIIKALTVLVQPAICFTETKITTGLRLCHVHAFITGCRFKTVKTKTV